MVDTYAASLDATGKVVAAIRPAEIAAPTPCGRYDVRALLNHLVGGFDMWVEMAQGRTVQFAGDEAPDVVGDDWAGAYERGAGRALRAFSAQGALQRTFVLPNGASVPGEQALGIALMEAVVHGWDLATASAEDGNPFGPEVAVAKDAPPSARLLAFLGRRP